jgi:hypothetical protein
MGGGDGVTLLTWISCLCRKFLLDDVEQPEAREWRYTSFIYIFIIDTTSRNLVCVCVVTVNASPATCTATSSPRTC